MKNTRPRLLILSFSDIANDARVLKQVKLFAEEYRVTTCGYGEPPDPRVRHIVLEARPQSRLVEMTQAVFRRAKCFEALRALEPFIRNAKKALQRETFDAAIVNDPEGAALAFKLVGAERTHVDLHEYFPGLQDDSQEWVRFRKPYYEWLIANDVRRAATATTVSTQIAERFQAESGVKCGVVHNALPYHELSPGEVHQPIRIVHSGAAQANRQIEIMMEAVAQATVNITLDLFLTGEKGAYAAKLRDLADRLGSRVNVHPPKPYADLLDELNKYDVGIHVVPPINTNYLLAMPNKFFDYVQARLGVVVGPTEAVAELVHRYEVGTVTEAFDVASVVLSLNSVTPEKVQRWKTHAAISAKDLSVDDQLLVWKKAVAALITV